MIDYAINKYDLITNDDKDDNTIRNSYERTLRRNLSKAGLVSINEVTGKHSYQLPEENAKYFIDNNMKKYFEKMHTESDEVVREKFAKKDLELNKKHFEAIRNHNYEEDYEYDYMTDPTPTSDEINNVILGIMIKAIFNLYYEFDYKNFINDYKELHILADSNDVLDPIQEGYSYLKNKIDNATTYYCKRKA